MSFEVVPKSQVSRVSPGICPWLSVCIREICLEKRSGSEDRVLQTIPEFCANPFYQQLVDYIMSYILYHCIANISQYIAHLQSSPRALEVILQLYHIISLYPMISPTPISFGWNSALEIAVNPNFPHCNPHSCG